MLGNLGNLGTFILHGVYDGTILVHQSRTSHALLKERGYDVTYLEDQRRGHNFLADHNPAVLDWLEPRARRDPWSPFLYRAVERGHAPERVHWLKVAWGRTYRPGEVLEGELEWVGQGTARRLVARIESTAALESLTVLLPPTPGDDPVSLEVHCNGQVVYTGEVAPSVAAVLDSWRELRDPHMVTTRAARVTLAPGAEAPNVGAR